MTWATPHTCILACWQMEPLRTSWPGLVMDLSLLLHDAASIPVQCRGCHVMPCRQSSTLTDHVLQMALETRARLESGIIGGGHRIAASRLDAQRSTAGYVSEAMSGLSYLDYIRALVPRIDSDWDSVKVRGRPHTAFQSLKL